MFLSVIQLLFAFEEALDSGGEKIGKLILGEAGLDILINLDLALYIL